MWSFTGQRFSWSRAQDGRCRIWLDPKSHSLAPDLNQQYPDFEYDEVSFLNDLEAYIVISEGDSNDVVRDVKASHRFAAYSAENDEIVDGCNATVSLIDRKICVEVRLGVKEMQLTLSDLLSATGRADGYYHMSTSSRFIDLTRAFGVKPEAKSKFLAGDISAILWGEVKFSYGFGDL